jgi:hypothetical protein
VRVGVDWLTPPPVIQIFDRIKGSFKAPAPALEQESSSVSGSMCDHYVYSSSEAGEEDEEDSVEAPVEGPKVPAETGAPSSDDGKGKKGLTSAEVRCEDQQRHAHALSMAGRLSHPHATCTYVCVWYV